MVRSRLQLAERGQWHQLLHDALAERESQRTSRDADPLAPHMTRTQVVAQAVRKTRNGCLKTAAQLLTGDGKAPHTEETIEKVWELCCGEPHARDAWGTSRRLR